MEIYLHPCNMLSCGLWCKQTSITQIMPLMVPPLWHCSPTWAITSSFLRFVDHSQWHITVGRTPLSEWSACCRDLCFATHNTPNRQTSMTLVGFEPTISTGEWPQTNALNCVATGTGCFLFIVYLFFLYHIISSVHLNIFIFLSNWPT